MLLIVINHGYVVIKIWFVNVLCSPIKLIVYMFLSPLQYFDLVRYHHHQPINVPTAGAQAFLMDYT
jgi:hypothetical protein